jgi:hypothetical protein
LKALVSLEQEPFGLPAPGLLPPAPIVNALIVIQRLDFSPLHFHRFRLRFNGLFGSAAAFGLARFCAADRAQ